MRLQVQRLQPTVRDRRAGWQQSLSALQLAKDSGARLTKTSIMLGCGEQPAEVLDTFKALRDHGARAAVSLAGRSRICPPIRHLVCWRYSTRLQAAMCSGLQHLSCSTSMR